ncbi:LCP family protein [Alkalibacterium sp. 20]|uniref:LCP family glycopolymer transferase n=1 Tax=Alkalibacterium sp. 20 TaxID=1798803 RepID=UPI0009004F01|nr:LCP family protein [Alkalibacterium sp. 20]OJF91860.1 transcriptional regulator [Alkalibacterium sp. 20]
MNEQSRSKRNQNNKKKKSVGKIVLSIFLLFLLVLTVAGGYVAWQVYSDLRATTDEMYEEVEEQEEHTARTDKPVVVDDGEDPFSILLMGVDTGEFDRQYQGRSDTMMVITVNPNTDKTSIVSIPRDTYTEIIGRGHLDKINHAYAFGGTSMAVNTVQNLFDIPVDYFVSVNMEGMQQVVDAVGGITVTPPLTFKIGEYQFVEGEPTHMDGNKALEYSRMRYEDPEGDYGRQHRQRQVIESTMQKVASLDSIRNYGSILETMSSTMRTNMKFDEMLDMFSNYRGAVNTVDQLQLSGQGEMIGGVYYEIIPDEEINRVQDYLKSELEL